MVKKHSRQNERGRERVEKKYIGKVLNAKILDWQTWVHEINL